MGNGIYCYITECEESEKGYEVNSTSKLVKAHTLPNVGHLEEECWEELWEDFWMDCTDL